MALEDMQKMFMDNRGLIGALGGAAAQEAIIRDVQKLGEQDYTVVYTFLLFTYNQFLFCRL